MSSVLTYNVRMQMTRETLDYWIAMLEQAKGCYNHCSKMVKEMGLPLSLKVIHARLYHELRGMFPLLPSQAVIKMQQEVLSAYKSIRKNKHRNAEVPQRKQLSMRLDKRIYSKFDIHGISITSSERNRRERATFVLYPKVSEMFGNYTTSDPLLFIRDGVPYLSVSFNVPDKPVTDDMSVGVDLGERLLFVTSEGKAFRDKAYLRERRKMRFKKKQLQSKGTKSAKRKLKKLPRREGNLSNDMCQRACNALLQSTHASVFVLEDLKKLKQGTAKTKEGYKNKSHNRRLSQIPFYKFKEILTYKAQLVGKRVETVSAYNTSQTDCRTGKTDGERHKRRYIGADGVVLDADYNAAVNIAKRGRHLFSMNVPKDGTLDILRGRAQSTARMHRPERPGASPSL